MNLEFIAAQSIHLANHPPFNRPALYIIEPNETSLKNKNCRRCGVAGSKSTVTAVEEGSEIDHAAGSKGSNLKSRCMMYFASWIDGGKLRAALTIPNAYVKGFTNENNRRSVPRAREQEFHKALENLGVERVRSGRSEWFRGDLATMKKALRSVGGTYYDFKGDFIPEGIKVERVSEKRDVLVPNRVSPRLSSNEIYALSNKKQHTPEFATAMEKIVAKPSKPHAPPAPPTPAPPAPKPPTPAPTAPTTTPAPPPAKTWKTRDELKAKLLAARAKAWLPDNYQVLSN